MYKPKFFQAILSTALLLLLAAVPPWAFLLRPGADVARASSQAPPPESHRPQAATLPAAMISVGDVLINEVMFQPDPSDAEWVELKNRSATALNLDGYGLTDEDDNWYRLPEALPDVPAGAFVVVIFDGLGSGSDDYDFSDNLVTLHTPAGLVNIFEDEADQVAFYLNTAFNHRTYLPLLLKGFNPLNPPVPERPSDFPLPSIVDFVAWGGPPAEDGSSAVTAGLWSAGTYLGTTQIPGGDGLLIGGSIGIYISGATASLADWVIYRPEQTSQGLENPLLAPYFRNPPNGITTDDHQIAFGWSIVAGAVSYHLEVDDDPGFGSPTLAVDVATTFYQPTTPFSDGIFYFRVKAVGASNSQSSYSPPNQVTFITVGALTQEISAQAALLGVIPKLQHKDTRMLDLDGSSETGPGRWDSAHETDGDLIVGNGTPVRANNLDNMYCTRASISMIVAYHGGNLSQDRIAYFGYGGGPPEGDLGHGVGLWPNQLATQGSGINVFNLAMNGNAVTSSRGKPTFAEVKGWIDAGRPMLVVENNDAHSVVLDGYLDLLFLELAHRVDPWTATSSWVLYSSWNISEYHVPPAGVTPRSDEDLDGDSIADTIDDSDGDGVSDFDERIRFGLFVNDPDSDGDLVQDLVDIREYVFDEFGNPRKPAHPDIDGDTFRKEQDPDNDYNPNEGTMDGCEDSNRNGKYEPNLSETDSFNPFDDKTLHIRLDWPKLDTDVDLHLLKPGAVLGSEGDVYFGNTEPDWGPPGTCGNPTLDVDCIFGCTVENIRLDTLETGVYSIKVHYYSDHGLDETSPTVTLSVQEQEYTFGPTELTDGQIWDVATITWPGGVVSPGALVSPQAAEEHLFNPEK